MISGRGAEELRWRPPWRGRMQGSVRVGLMRVSAVGVLIARRATPRRYQSDQHALSVPQAFPVVAPCEGDCGGTTAVAGVHQCVVASVGVRTSACALADTNAAGPHVPPTLVHNCTAAPQHGHSPCRLLQYTPPLLASPRPRRLLVPICPLCGPGLTARPNRARALSSVRGASPPYAADVATDSRWLRADPGRRSRARHLHKRFQGESRDPTHPQPCLLQHLRPLSAQKHLLRWKDGCPTTTRCQACVCKSLSRNALVQRTASAECAVQCSTQSASIHQHPLASTSYRNVLTLRPSFGQADACAGTGPARLAPYVLKGEAAHTRAAGN